MKNEIGLEPDVIKKLERRAARKAKVNNYELWVWGGLTLQINTCDTKEEARSMWLGAKRSGWEKWELQQDRKIIAEGVF